MWPTTLEPRADLAMERGVTDADLHRELCDRFPGEMTIRQVVKVRHFDFSDHVYLPQTMTGYYMGILVSRNCDHIPVVLEDQDWNSGTVWDGANAPDQFAKERRAVAA
jgi:hypothetical protein